MTDLQNALESISAALAVAIDDAKTDGKDTVVIKTSLEKAEELQECIDELLAIAECKHDYQDT